ncbi:MAG: hypothetical protein ACRDKE_08465 [Solirubrobacterales bacterium]
MKTLLVTTCALFLCAAFFATTAVAAAPSNDARLSAQAVTVPQTLSGLTAEATVETGEDSECFASTKNSVWYQVTGAGKRVAIGLEADGDLDAVVDVFNYSRSQPASIDCSATDKSGLAIVDFTAKRNTVYFVRVSERLNSVSGTFSLKFLTGSDPATKPGHRLPAKGVSDTVNLVSDESDAWAVTLRAGTSYRFNLAASSENGACTEAAIYAPGQSLDSDSAWSVNCSDSFTLITPGSGEGGRYTVLVRSTRRSFLTQKYRLTVAKARRDDTAPGVFWRSGAKHGSLNSRGADIEDIYNFDLDRRAIVNLRVSSNADFEIQLRSIGGRRLASSDSGEIDKKLPPGTYYAIVLARDGAAGKYTLRRNFRTITHTTLTFNGSRYALTSKGQSVTLSAIVAPAGRGRLEITLQRKDPLHGWLYMRTYKGSGLNGGRTVSFTPPAIGEYRARAVFKGSRSANPSRSRYARVSVRR